MPATVNVNLRTVVHASSNGVAMAFPDVCKTPSPAGPIPIPYPNIAVSSDTSQGSSTVKCDGNPVMIQGAVFSKSNGDEAGAAGGVVSNTNMGKAEFILYSFDVKFDGKNVCRMADLMMMNKGPGAANTPPFPEIQPPNPAVIVPDPEEQKNRLKSIEIKT